MNQVTASPSAWPRSFAMTYVIIAINVATYLIVASKGGATYENLLAFGAKENGLIAEGEVGRLFFPMFLHAGLLHLAFNMYGLYQVGRVLEVLAGPKRLFVLYIVSGITGNLSSFAFSRALSVGASGSLFGILLCLYVIEKYEERMSGNDDAPRRSGLGPLILINGIISFVIPNIDWANHMGGAIAGALMGMGLVMRHRFNLRRLRAAKFLGIETQVAKAPFFERERLYYFLLLLVNVGFACTVTRIGIAERSFGLGVKMVTESQTAFRSVTSLPQFSKVIGSPKAETYPETLIRSVANLHMAGYYAPAVRMYEVLVTLHSNGIGTPEFLSSSTLLLLQLALEAARNSQEVPEEFLTASQAPSSSEGTMAFDELCEKPAILFRALGFYELSGKLFECEYYLRIGDRVVAARTIESYWLADLQRDVVRFVNIAQALQTNELSPTELPKVLSPFSLPEKYREEPMVPDENEQDPRAI